VNEKFAKKNKSLTMEETETMLNEEIERHEVPGLPAYSMQES
jgi:hypothetical protein